VYDIKQKKRGVIERNRNNDGIFTGYYVVRYDDKKRAQVKEEDLIKQSQLALEDSPVNLGAAARRMAADLEFD
jgi:hypothetical protein